MLAVVALSATLLAAAPPAAAQPRTTRAQALQGPAKPLAPRHPPTVSQAEAISLAIAHNPELRAAEKALAAAKARQTQATAWPNPNLSLLIDQVPLQTPSAGNYMAGLAQPLLPGGLREARVAIAKLDVELADLARRLTHQTLESQVKEAYVRHQFDHEAVRLAHLGREATDALYKATAARYRAGELARIDMLRVELEKGRAARDLAAAESRDAQTLAELNALLGRPLASPVEVKSPTLTALFALPSADTLVTRALDHRVELKQAALSIEREAAQRQLAAAGLWTGTEATVAGGLVAGQPGFSATMTLPVPFYRQQGEVAEAVANQGRAEAERDALRFRITLEVQHAYHDALIAQRQVNLFQQGYVTQAEKLADNAQRRYAAGEGSGLEVAEARLATRQAHLDLMRAALEWQQALVRVERVLGCDLLIEAKK